MTNGRISQTNTHKDPVALKRLSTNHLQKPPAVKREQEVFIMR